jgi:DNA-binding IscR family transcriptional regulator
MATQRKTKTTTTTTQRQVFRSIVNSILTNNKREFTSTDIAEAASASPRHSRRTLSELAQKRVLSVKRGSSPFIYTVAQRATLRQLANS